jgi:hypothetical protein
VPMLGGLSGEAVPHTDLNSDRGIRHSDLYTMATSLLHPRRARPA